MRPRYTLLLLLLAWSPRESLGHEPPDPDLSFANPVKIERTRETFPTSWISVGGRLVGDTVLFERLRGAFPDYVRTSTEDVGTYTLICVKSMDASYMTFAEGPFGPYLTVSAKVPAYPCAEADASWNQTLSLDSGLRLGLSKTEAATALKIGSVFDSTQIAFEETETQRKYPVYHMQSISLKFDSEHLILVLIQDYREGNMSE
jgi:hypothetical protein